MPQDGIGSARRTIVRKIARLRRPPYLCASQRDRPPRRTALFTGIVEEVGTVRSVEPAGNGAVFTIGATRVLEGMALGDSVAVDGACLTVTRILPDGFTVDAVRTTLERTTFGGFEAGRRVNLERALAFGARLGGHLVSGHVDGVGEVRAVEESGELTLYDFTLPEEVRSVTVLHGSVTLNGISLTVNALPAPGVCQVSIIPFTREHTAIGDLRPGDAVNVEGDLIGKHVRTLLAAPGEGEHLRRAWGYE
jgi:riboflavin synthase